MILSYELLEKIGKDIGESFYILDTEQFKKNFQELSSAFNMIYSKTYIAYSYKTNYIPRVCKIVDQLGGFAEVVSDMEAAIAEKAGVLPSNIYFNGPYKNPQELERLLLLGTKVNIDSYNDFEVIKAIAERHQDKSFSVGIRCNFDIKNGIKSRFGVDVTGKDFLAILKEIRDSINIKVIGLHCHFSSRCLDTWSNRVKGIIEIGEKYFDNELEYISLGGGMYGKMADCLKEQFEGHIPCYEEYARVVATEFSRHYGAYPEDKKPMLLIEPGSALAGDIMKFASKVISIKDVRGKKIATLKGSVYNINPTLNKKNPPITVFNNNNTKDIKEYKHLDFGGFTCIEADFLYRGYNGNVAVGDYVMFDNVGSYSVVLKPPFILPNFAIVEYDQQTNHIEIVKRQETFEDVFQTYSFN